MISSRLLAVLIPFILQGCGPGLNVGMTPVLRNLLVDIQPCTTNPCTGGTAGAFSFLSSGNHAPIVFGATVPASSGGQKLIPNLELRVLSTADILSPVDGVISSIEKNSSQDDYAVSISHSALSEFSIEIDHVTALQVQARDRVSAGQILGKPGIWYPADGIGRVELQMKRGGDFICPVEYLAADVATELRNKVLDLLEDWEQVKSNTSLYDENAMVVPGCLRSTISGDEA
jgi:hypothetical protein